MNDLKLRERVSVNFFGSLVKEIAHAPTITALLRGLRPALNEQVLIVS